MTTRIVKIYYMPLPESGRNKNEPTGKWLLRMFTEARSLDLAPRPLARKGVLNTTARVQVTHDKILKSLKNQDPKLESIPDGRLIGMMVQALLNYRQEQKAREIERTITPGKIEWRPEQIQYHGQISEGLIANRIVLAEGATGIGKGLVMARLANEACQDGRGPVVICSPTVSTLLQNFSEWQVLKKNQSAPEAGIILGRQCFTDIDALVELIKNKDLATNTKTNVQQWIDKGSGHVPGSGTLTLHRYCPEISALIDDLFHLAPELTPYEESICLRDADEESPGEKSYRLLVELSREASVKYCTHAMVALDRMMTDKNSEDQNNGSIIGNYNTLFVDEAHTFEASVANVFSRSTSIYSLRAHLRKGDIGTKKKRSQCVDVCNKIIAMSNDLLAINKSDDLFILPKDWRSNSDKVRTLRQMGLFSALSELKTNLEGLKKKNQKLPPWFHETIRTLNSCPPPISEGDIPSASDLAGDTPIPRNWSAVMFTVSPKRGLLSVSAGSVNVQRVLERIWRSAEKGVALISATLLLPDGLGGVSGRFALSVLGLLRHPDLMDRVIECPPVIPSWVTDPVHLFYPDPERDIDLAEALKPPTTNEDDNYEEQDDQWLDVVAEQLSKVATSAKGGTLVLLSAYDRQKKLLFRLEELGHRDRLIYQNPGGVPYSANQYRAMVRAGERPIWLAVGSPAWMGLDLNDKDDPLLLTDLVIPRLPFGLAHGITAKWRSRYGSRAGIGHPPFIAEAAFALRQGIGRLVRHAEVKEKNLWILDSRPWLAKKTEGQKSKIYTMFRVLLRPYQHHFKN